MGFMANWFGTKSGASHAAVAELMPRATWHAHPPSNEPDDTQALESALALQRALDALGSYAPAREDYFDVFMRDAEQKRKAVRYIEHNPVKAKLCRAPEEWPFSSARYRDPQTRELKLPK